MMRSANIVFFLILAFSVQAQVPDRRDTMIGRDMQEVVVTATRSERLMGNTSVPVTLISQKTISESGSLRLHDILGEQTGLFITQGFGRGVQMQGLSPDYTLILIDGEPVIGRMGGVLDLSRLTVGNIRKIEIVKGPSSSLYGSEALAGVINIITDGAGVRKLHADIRYGRFNTFDASAEVATRVGKMSLSGFVNSNSTEGYSLLPNSIQKTVEPFWRLTNQFKLGYDFSPATQFRLGIRYNHEDITNSIVVQNLGSQLLSKGSEINRDLNITPTLTHRFNKKVKTSLRGYLSRFASEQNLDVRGELNNYNDRFRQSFSRIENQTDVDFTDRLSLNAGGGMIFESVRSNRYDSLETIRSNQIGYFFIQQEWRALERLTITAGLRYDHNSAYASVWSPKLALQYRMNPKWRLNASAGRGFKAPDFRQLFLNFTNIAAGSYSVFGSLVAADEIIRLQSDGQIDQILPSYGKLSELKPETSTGINLGLQFDPSARWNARINLYRNDIENLILTDIIAYKKNGGQIFSYLNISSAFTQGLELEGNWQVHKQIRVSGGYQLLVTAEKNVLTEISEGKVYKRDISSGLSSRLTRSEYAGLPGRSKHMANLKVFLESSDSRWFANARLIYRSRWGVSDIDGNGIINREDEFAKGYLQANLALGRQLSPVLGIKGGVDNLFNYKDPENLPGMPGANWYLSLSANFLKSKQPSKQ
jgi:outer membrane receptor for ferrienterochelin and colicins